MAKISVLIPTYNRPHFLVQALESVLNQTRLPDEIIIGDDNVDSNINHEVLEPYLKKYSFIKYIKNKEKLGAAGNYKNLFKLASGDYIKWLADDDILMPSALEKAIYYLEKYPDVKLVSSIRVPVNENLEPISLNLPKISDKNTIVDGYEINKKMLISLMNLIGEFSVTLFRKKDISFNLFKFRNIKFKANSDWLTWLKLLEKGKLAYISEPLSYFRVTTTQDQYNPETIINGSYEVFNFVFDKYFSKKYNISIEEKKEQIKNYINKYIIPIVKYKNNPNFSDKVNKIIKKTFIESSKYLSKRKRKPVSIITVTYNSERTLVSFLESVLRTINPDDEFIIVDNNSKDKTKDILYSYKSNNIKIIFNKENVGYSKGINIGIKHSKNPFVIFLNPDTEVYGSWVDTLTAHLIDEKVGAVGPLTTYTVLRQYIFTYLDKSLKECLSYEEISKITEFVNRGKSIETPILIGFCLATKREVLDKIGYMDEDLFLGNDDLEFSWRLRENGYKLKIALDTFIYHEGHVSFKTEKKSKTDILVQDSTNKLADKLIRYYGYGNVPHPLDLWEISWFTPKGEKYKYMFKIFGRKGKIINNTDFKDKISIILVNYKNSKDTAEAVKSLLKQNYENISIIIVDNSEDENSIEELKTLLKDNNPKFYTENDSKTVNLEFKKDITVIRATENRGFSAGNNIGIKVSLKNKADYIWILNNDTLVEKNTIEEMLKVSKVYNISVVTCKMKDFKEKDKVQYDGKFSYITPIEDKVDIIKPVSFLSGANIFAKAEVFEKIGLLDEDFFLYFEDNDFHYRLLKNDIKVIYTPFTHIYHKGGSSTGGYLKNPLSMYYFVRNILLIRKKHKHFNYEEAFKEIEKQYAFNYKDKIMLKSIILGLYDFIKGITGRKENLLEEINKKIKIKKVKKDELDKQNIDTLFKLSFSYPRNKEYFLAFLENIRKSLT